MNNQNIDDVLSERIKRYKARLEGITLKGLIQRDSERNMVRVLFEVPSGFPPMYAEIREADVILVTPEETGKAEIVQIKRGADYVLSIVTSAGLEEDLPVSIRDILEGGLGEAEPGRTQ